MKYFNGLTLKKGNITVLGAEKDSVFVTDLEDYLKDKKDINIFAPDTTDGKFFVVHSEEEINRYQNDGYIIGVINIDVCEKRIADAIKGYEHLCEIADISPDELVFPYAVAKTILQREKYNLLFIDGVNSVSKRFLARELAKNIRNGMSIRIINTDNGDIEILCR